MLKKGPDIICIKDDILALGQGVVTEIRASCSKIQGTYTTKMNAIKSETIQSLSRAKAERISSMSSVKSHIQAMRDHLVAHEVASGSAIWKKIHNDFVG